MRKIILASTSPRRKMLLEKTGLTFEVVAGNYEEDMTLPLSPRELVKFLSKGKAESVAKNYDDAIIIGGDTIVFFNGHVLGKPHTREKAKEMLTMLNGHEHSVFTGITVIDTQSKKVVSEAVESKVKFKNLPEGLINEYLKTKEPLTRAGAYEFQTVGETFVEKTEGDKDNIIGLPVASLMKILESFGVKL